MSHIIDDVIGYLEVIVRGVDGDRRPRVRREERRQLTPGAGAGSEEPKSNLDGHSFSSSQTSTTRFFGSAERPRRHGRR